MTDNARGKSRWTPRFVLRLAGAAALLVVILMALLGAYVLDFTGSARSFFIYWSVFFLLFLSVIALAMLDAIVTIAKFRQEHAKLRKAFRQEFGGKGGTES